MDAKHLATETLHAAEASLREIVAKAASAGDYDAVMSVASLASAVAALRNGRSIRPTKPPKARATSKNRRGTSKHGYPRFFRRDDNLVRVSWSKRDKKEYQHKAPRTVLRALVAAISRVGKNGQIFSTDIILPIRDGDGNEVPSYQAYVGISLLKHLRLIDQHGRQGYSVPALEELAKALDAAWSKMPTK